MGESSPAFRELSHDTVANPKTNILPNLPEKGAIVPDETLGDDGSILLNSKMVWEGSQFVDEATYTRVLNDQERDEVTAALKHFKGVDPHSIPIHCSTTNPLVRPWPEWK
jgi:hypothetical protein